MVLLMRRWMNSQVVRSCQMFQRTVSRTNTTAAIPNTTNLSHEFRVAMRKVPSPVVVITASSPTTETARGMTCSSFTSVSLNPPIIQFSIRTPSSTSHLLRTSPTFAIHILSHAQSPHAATFAVPKTQGDFHLFPHHLLPPTGVPILHGCLGVLVCKARGWPVDVGDHEVWFGEVVEVLKEEKGVSGTDGGVRKDPLVYFQSSYRSVGDEVFIQAFESATLAVEMWTHRAHLRMCWIYLQSEDSVDAAYLKIRDGIQKYNTSNAHRITHRYNDTITRFFLSIIQLALQDQQLQHPETAPALENDIDPADSETDFSKFLERYSFLENKKMMYAYYSVETLHGDEAAESWVQPDKRPLPTTIDELYEHRLT